MNQLNLLYAAMLRSWDVNIAEDGALSVRCGNQDYPINIDEMRVYLPLTSVLDSNTMDKVFFHPACESIMSKEPEVFRDVIRKVTGFKLITLFKSYFMVLCNISKKKGMKNLRMETIEMLEPFGKLNASQRSEIVKLLERMEVVKPEESNVDNRMIYFNITKGGTSRLSGSKIYYKTKPQFPIYVEMVRKLSRAEGSAANHIIDVNGYSISKAALETAVHFFKSTFRGVESPDDYEYEYCHADAARLCSFLGSYTAVAEDMNRIQNLFRSEFDKEGIYALDLSWNQQIENISELYTQVPPLNYNNNNTSKSPSATSAASVGNLFSSTTSVGQQVQPQVQQVQQVQQVVTSNIVKMPNGVEVDITPPQLAPGEVYQSYQIDPSSFKVAHTVRTAHGTIAIYYCSRMGSYLERIENGMPQTGFGGFGGFGQGFGGFGQGFGNPWGAQQQISPFAQNSTFANNSMPGVSNAYYEVSTENKTY